MRSKQRNALIFVIDDIMVFLEKKLGVFGPFSFRLLFGLVLGVLSLFAFAALSEDLLFHELTAFDSIVTGIVRYFTSVEVTRIMTGVSQLGSPLFLIIVGVLVMLYTGLARRHFWDTLLVPVTMIGGIILNGTLKFLYHRQRPSLEHLVKVTGFSFPSGHAMLSFIFYGLLIYLVWVNFRNMHFRIAVTALLAAVILAVGVSRIYLGVHYPSDVLAGFAAGSFWLVACVLGLRGIRYYKDGD